MFGLATRHDAMPSNPVRDTARLPSSSKSRRALTLEEVWDMRAKIGETSAITWPSLDLEAGTVEVRGTVIRISGKGLIIKLKPKSKAGWRIIELPAWAVAMLKGRQEEQEPNEWQAVFTSPLGHLRDPSNTQADLKDVFDRIKYPNVTSHTFRRTVATLMDEARLSARAAADQLGHAKVSMTQDHYFGRNGPRPARPAFWSRWSSSHRPRTKSVGNVWRRSWSARGRSLADLRVCGPQGDRTPNPWI